MFATAARLGRADDMSKLNDDSLAGIIIISLSCIACQPTQYLIIRALSISGVCSPLTLLNLSDPSDRLAPSPKDDTWMASHTTPKGLEHVG